MKPLFAAILACLLLNLTGCISYSNHELASVEQWPPAAPAAHKPSAFVKVYAQYLHNDVAKSGGVNQPGLEALILKEYQSSQRFASVTTAKQAADMYISVKVTNNERSNLFSAALTGFSLFIIPTRFTNQLTMETTFKDVNGNLLGRVKKSETITSWMQLLMIFALPFNESADNIFTQLSKSTLEQASKDKLI
ncbi:hypothetical protein ACIGCM_03065 [Pseudomonas sp. NPDC078700]|uniref:hypothetical protein n=1 Tax=Pseudomonas sp. NPDC078700 TaxID=3364424 RepID=UPI0037CB3828